MIKYKLICKDCNIQFDSWFASSIEYEKLKKKNFLTCNNCNSTNVEKTLMAPKFISKNSKEFTETKSKKFLNIKKRLKNIKNLLKIILIMWVKTLLMRRDLFITIKKKRKKAYMGQPQKVRLKNLRKKV